LVAGSLAVTHSFVENPISQDAMLHLLMVVGLVVAATMKMPTQALNLTLSSAAQPDLTR
jgi:hypothetical protein